MSKVTRCKMILSSITRTMGSKYDPELPPMTAGGGKGGYVPSEQYTVKFYPVADGSEENKRFFASTPSGSLELSIVNAAAVEHLKLNQPYYVDIVEAAAS